jgi:hypothetical protein
MKTWFEIVFYFTDSIGNEFSAQKFNGIINVGLGATLSWSTLRAAYQFKWWYGLRLVTDMMWASS